MTGPIDPFFTPDLAAQYQKVLGAHAVFTTRPNVAAALAQANPDVTTLQAVGGFLESLDLAKQVRLSRTGGAKMVLSDQDRAYLTMLGEEYSDVDAAPIIAATAQAQKAVDNLNEAAAPKQANLGPPVAHGFWGHAASIAGAAAHMASKATETPGIHQVVEGLGIAADAFRGGARIGEYGLSKIMPDAIDPMDPGGENDRQMRERGYDPGNPLSVLAFFATGKQNYNSLDDLREKYGDGQVKAAQDYLEHPEDFDISPNFDDATNVARIAAVNNPDWKALVKSVNSRHQSIGRELALGFHLDPNKGEAFNRVSGPLDAVESWFGDPTLIGGKISKANKVRKLGINSLTDEAGIRRVVATNQNVRRGLQSFLDRATAIRTGTAEGASVEERAAAQAAYAALRSENHTFLPLLDEVNGKVPVVVNKTAKLAAGMHGPEKLVKSTIEFHKTEPITTLDELTEYLVTKNALVRTLRGAAPKTGVYMPGSVSRYAAAKAARVEKAAYKSGLAHENRLIDLAEDGAKVLPTPDNAVGGPLETAASRGDALAKDVAGMPFQRSRFLRLAKRLSTLAPSELKFDYFHPKAVDAVYKWAAATMPKAEARMLAARFSTADLAGRRAIRMAMVEQSIHSAGLESSATGRELAKRMRADLGKEGSQQYSLADDADLITDAAGTRRVGVFPGQVNTEMWLPSFTEMQKVAAKVSLYDHTLKRVADNVVTEKIMQTLRSGWLLTSAGAIRNIMDGWAGAAGAGMGWQTFKGKLALSSQRSAARAMEREMPAGELPAATEAAYHKARISRVLGAISRVKGSALGHISSDEFQEAAEIMGEEIAQGHVAKLGMTPTALVTGVADPHSLEDVAEITRLGARPAAITFGQWEQKGWGPVAAEGEKGARNWAHNLDQVVSETPELAQRLVSVVRQGPSDEVLTKLVETSREAKTLAKSSESMAATLDRTEPVINKLADAIVRFGKNKGAAERWYRANDARDLDDLSTLKDMRDALTYLRERSAQTLEDPKLQRAAKRHTPGAKDAMEASKRRDLTALIDKTGVLDDIAKQIDEHLSKVADLSAAKRAAARDIKGKDYTQELIEHIVDHPEMQQFRDLAELARPLKDATTREAKLAIGRDIADRMTRSFAELVTGKDGQPIHNLLDRLEKGQVPSLEWFGKHVPNSIRPNKVIGREWAAVPANPDKTGLAGLGQMLGKGYTAFLSKGYETVVSGPINRMANQPIFLGNFVKARRNLGEYERKLVDEGLSPEAAKTHATKLALDHALDMTSRMIDNPEVASQMATMSRNLVNFPRAAEDWVRRWSRLVKEDPTIIRKVQLAVEGGQHSGVIDHDANGNLILTYPGSGAAINALLKVGEALRIPHIASIPTVPDLHTNLMYLNPSLNNPFFPGASPLVTTPIKVLQGFFPESRLMLQDMNTALTGDDRGASQGVMDQFFPTVVKNMFKAFTADEKDAQMSSAIANAIVHMEAAGLAPPPNASEPEREAYLARVKTAAKNQLFVRAVFAFALPGTPSLPDNQVAGDSTKADALFQAQGLSSMDDEAKALISKLGMERALAVWTKLHPDKLMYFVGKSKVDSPYASVPVTRGAELWLEENLDFVKKYPGLAAYFVPDAPGDFSPEAYRAQLETGIRSRKGMEDFYADTRVITAEQTYYAVKDRRDREIAKAKSVGDDEGVRRAKAIWTQWTQGDGTTAEPGFLNMNPLFAAKLASYGERTVWREEAIGSLEKLLASGQLGNKANQGDTISLGKAGSMPIDTATAKGLAAFVTAYRRHDAFTKQMRGRRDSGSLAAKSEDQRMYEEYMLSITGASYDADGRLTGGNSALRDVYQGLFRGLD